jgi:hypothetical protein
MRKARRNAAHAIDGRRALLAAKQQMACQTHAIDLICYFSSTGDGCHNRRQVASNSWAGGTLHVLFLVSLIAGGMRGGFGRRL